MPLPPKILEDLDKRRRKNKLPMDIDVVSPREDFDTVLLCPNCNVSMGLFTDKITGHFKGYVCPQCSHTYDPKTQSKSQGGKTKRQMTTTDGGINSQDIDLRREITSVSTNMARLHDGLYQPRGDASNSSVTKLFSKKLEYAGKKKKPDSDDELLQKMGFTILDSRERLPT